MNLTMDERLIDAAVNGNVDELLRVLPYANAKHDESSALRAAALYGHDRCVEALLPHSDVSVRKCSPLRMAFLYNHSACVKLLVEPSIPFICQDEDESFRFSEIIRGGVEGNSPALMDIVPLVEQLPSVEQVFILQSAVRFGREDFIKQILPLCNWNGLLEVVNSGTVADPGLVYLDDLRCQLQNELLLREVDTTYKLSQTRKM